MTVGKVNSGTNVTCDNCHQRGHAWRHCPKMSEQDKIAFAAKKGINYKGAPKGGGKGQGGKWGGNGGKAWDYGKGIGNQWGKGWQLSGNKSYGKGFGKKGLNEMGGNGWDSDDVWGPERDPSATAGPALGAHAHIPVPVLWNPIPYAEQIQRLPRDGRRQGELGPSDSKMHNQFPLMRESSRVMGERANEVPAGGQKK